MPAVPEPPGGLAFYEQQGEYERCVYHPERAVVLQPDHAGMHYRLARCYFGAGYEMAGTDALEMAHSEIANAPWSVARPRAPVGRCTNGSSGQPSLGKCPAFAARSRCAPWWPPDEGISAWRRYAAAVEVDATGGACLPALDELLDAANHRRGEALEALAVKGGLRELSL